VGEKKRERRESSRTGRSLSCGARLEVWAGATGLTEDQGNKLVILRPSRVDCLIGSSWTQSKQETFFPSPLLGGSHVRRFERSAAFLSTDCTPARRDVVNLLASDLAHPFGRVVGRCRVVGIMDPWGLRAIVSKPEVDLCLRATGDRVFFVFFLGGGGWFGKVSFIWVENCCPYNSTLIAYGAIYSEYLTNLVNTGI
jgi:hypothetical protein